MQHKYSTVRNKFQPSDSIQFSGTSAGKRSVSKVEPCPACGHTDWCFWPTPSKLQCNRAKRYKKYTHDTKEVLNDGLTYTVSLKNGSDAVQFVLNDKVAKKADYVPTVEVVMPSTYGKYEVEGNEILAAIIEIMPKLHDTTNNFNGERAYATKKWSRISDNARVVDGWTIHQIDKFLRQHQEATGTPGTQTNAMNKEVTWKQRLRVEDRYNYIFFPICQNWDEKITSGQLRPTIDREVGKYLSLSGSKGASNWSGLKNKNGTVRACIISEGYMKTETAMKELGFQFGIALMGYDNLQAAVDAAVALTEREVADMAYFLALDRGDKDINLAKNVRNIENAIADQIAGINLHVEHVIWNGANGKGIDDMLQNNAVFHFEPHAKNKVKLLKSADEYMKKKQAKRTLSGDFYDDVQAARDEAKAQFRKVLPGEFYSGLFVENWEAGIGKTHLVADVLEALRNVDEYGIYAVPDKTKISEFLKRLEDKCGDISDVAVYRGRSEDNCINDKMARKLMGQDRNVEYYLCKTCPLFNKECKYQQQKEVAKNARLVVSTHAALSYILSEKEPLGQRQHIYIDENIVPTLFKRMSWSYERLTGQASFIRTESEILRKQAIEIANSTEYSQDKKDEMIAGIEANRAMMDVTARVLDKTAKILEDTRSNTETFSESIPFTELRNKINRNDLFRAVAYVESMRNQFNEISKMEPGVDLKKGIVPQRGLLELFEALNQHSDYDLSVARVGSYVELVVMQKNSVLIKRLEQRSVLLDASANVEHLKKIFCGLKVSEIRIKPQAEIRVVAVKDLIGASMQAMNEDYVPDRILELIKNQNLTPDNTGIIAVKDILTKTDKINEYAGYFTAQYGSDARGTNKLEGLNAAIITDYSPNLLSKYQEFMLFWKKHERLVVNKEGIYDIVRGSIRTKFRSADKDFDRFYKTEKDAEIYQAGMRLRLATRTTPATIWWLGDALNWPESLPQITHKISFRKERRSANHEKKEANKKLTAAEVGKILRRNAVNPRAWVKGRGLMATAKQIVEKLENIISAKTILQYFQAGDFWRLLEELRVGTEKIGKAINEVFVPKAIETQIVYTMKRKGIIDDEKVLLSRL